jgi:predicted DNA-binding transcriptional regulator YafY
MRFVDKKEKLDFLLEIIKKEHTGNAEDLCVHIYVSKRTLLRYISDLRNMGNHIGFCIQRNTYYLIREYD